MQPEQDAYRWVIVTASALILALALGSIANGFSAYLVPLEELDGWTRSQTSAVNFAGLIGLAFGGYIVGRQADRVGTRPLVLAGVVVLGLCYLLAAAATQLWHLYAIFLIAGFFGAGAIFAPIFALVGNWFTTGAGLAIGLASAGQALGQGGVPYASSLLIERMGPSAALAITGAAMLLLLVPLSLLLRPRPPQATASTATSGPAHSLSTREVVTTLSIGIVLCCTCMATPLMHLVPAIQETCGAPLAEASSVLFGMLLIAILGRVAFGRLADSIGALPAYMTATLWMTLLVYGFMVMESLGTFRTYALVYGFGYAGVMTGVLVSIRALVPANRRAGALGIVTMFGWFGHALGGIQGGVFHDLTNSYHAAFGVAALAGVLNLALIFRLYLRSKGPDGLSPRPT